MRSKIHGRIKVIVAILSAVVLGGPCALVALQNSNAKLIALIQADQRNSKIARSDAWPDISATGLHNLEARDRATLAQLHAISRNGLGPENRELYDLLEWQIDGRLAQMRVRLYLTPFCQDRRLLPGGGDTWRSGSALVVAGTSYGQRLRRTDSEI